MMMYSVAKASEILVITGAKIDGIKLAKKGWILPGQKCVRCDISPVSYTFEVQAMSAEKLPFILPVVFTIGPQIDDGNESLRKYVMLISPPHNYVKGLVQEVVEGEVRLLASKLTMEGVFQELAKFKVDVSNKVQPELTKLGLWIYNASVKQPVDVRGSDYLSLLGQKTQKVAQNQAIIDAKELEGKMLQHAAEMDAETKTITSERYGDGKKLEIKVNSEVIIYGIEREVQVAEANASLAKAKAAREDEVAEANALLVKKKAEREDGVAEASAALAKKKAVREAEIADAYALLAKKKAECAKEVKMAEVEAAKAVALRDAELEKQVEKVKAETRYQNLSAELVAKASIEYGTRVLQANGDLYEKQKLADGYLYQKEKEGEAAMMSASNALFTQKQEAEGIKLTLESLGGNYDALRDYLMIRGGTYQDLAQANAQAIQGLQPKFNIWTNGGDAPGGIGGAVAEVYRSLPQLFSTVHEQTGMLPATWMRSFNTNSA